MFLNTFLLNSRTYKQISKKRYRIYGSSSLYDGTRRMGWYIHETHYQPDLTPENMLERYPSLELFYSNEWYGYYISKNIKVEKAYVLYANAAYFKTVQGCVALYKSCK
jgi:hypothetical protein